MNSDYRETRAGRRRFARPRIYAATLKWQAILHHLGIAWHNTFADECTPDFNCCSKHIGRKKWLRIPKRKARR